MKTATESTKVSGYVMRAVFFVFGTVVASGGFVVACVLARDHEKYSFLQVWLAIAAIVIMVTSGLLWMGVSLRRSTPINAQQEELDPGPP